MNIEERLYSVTMTEEELKLFSEFLNEVYSLEERNFSENKDENKIPINDRVNIALDKALLTRRERDAIIEAYDRDSQKGHKLSAHAAKRAAIGTGVVGASLAAASRNPKLLIPTAAGAAIAGVSTYAVGRLGHAINKKSRKISSDMEFRSQREADRAKVANGEMSREEFAQIYGSRKKK